MRYNEMMVKRIVLFLALLLIGLVVLALCWAGVSSLRMTLFMSPELPKWDEVWRPATSPCSGRRTLAMAMACHYFVLWSLSVLRWRSDLSVPRQCCLGLFASLLIANVVTIWGAYKLGKELSGILGGTLLAALLTLAPTEQSICLCVVQSVNCGDDVSALACLGMVATGQKEQVGLVNN